MSNEPLHSNMFLLIPARFTAYVVTQESLHSNMFLLILIDNNTCQRGDNFTFQYVSINTIGSGGNATITSNFTFQYVSINTREGEGIVKGYAALHSNMFLLIHSLLKR